MLLPMRLWVTGLFGAACGVVLSVVLVPFAVVFPHFVVDLRLQILLATVGACVGVTFGFMTRRDRSSSNRQDPRGLHPPPGA